ncbi:nucleoside deaminase [Streptomyces sp. H10-C2]|uniref:nucleoside deaminase n=1 Tax=unclassified Streptomyces TaxID=2593676 RepID=UPI0024B8E4C8|nr:MULTISPECIES: nucleoside deaminase [unclassified Streptomyces]MDJ0340816.1 nucleoside deaminase [Streptomyces sp. PH10-H1]MDJ0371656.1 nucleoside deaminase [Streptomyces sp. H10-C2]
MTVYTQETSIQELERTWMDEAIGLATTSVKNGGGPFGALIAMGSEIVAIGHNKVTSNLDPTAHGEVSAIRAACQKRGTFSLEGCVLVTSCEPCPMCLSSALWARVDRIIFAADRHDAAMAGFDDRKFYDLFEKKPAELWPMAIERVDMPNPTAPFDAWLAKSDRIDY